MPTPTLSIIILSWNVRDLLRKCLHSLPSPSDDVEVIVVDGGSADDSVAMVRAEFPLVQLIAHPDNLGYTRGNNLGLRAAQGRYLLVLNPDTEIIGDALAQMTTYLDAHPRIGLLGPQMRFADGKVQSTRRRFPTLATGFFESTWFQPLAPRALLAHYYVRDAADDAVSEVDWVVGAALCVRREAYEQVGGLDEGFFMYSEELDWCRRMKAHGWQVVYYPPAQIIHHEAQSSTQVPAATHIRFNTSKIRYFRKYHGALAAETLRWFLLGNFAGQWLLESVKGALGHKRDLRQRRAQAYWQVLQSGLKSKQ